MVEGDLQKFGRHSSRIILSSPPSSDLGCSREAHGRPTTINAGHGGQPEGVFEDVFARSLKVFSTIRGIPMDIHVVAAYLWIS